MFLPPYPLALRMGAQTETTLIRRQNGTPLMRCAVFVLLISGLTAHRWLTLCSFQHVERKGHFMQKSNYCIPGEGIKSITIKRWTNKTFWGDRLY
ncbi:hypothetical protein TNCV_4458381 [Trichonephila clavipes]|nr:hypothetical protein TNCV_4458381 [Trichonephila clavipes]